MYINLYSTIGLHWYRPVTKGGSVGSYEPPPPRDHVGPLGPFFLYVFRNLDCHNIRYCLNCRKFDELILSEVIKTVATRCQILRLKFTKFDIGWGSAPDPVREAYRAPPRSF